MVNQAIATVRVIARAAVPVWVVAPANVRARANVPVHVAPMAATIAADPSRTTAGVLLRDAAVCATPVPVEAVLVYVEVVLEHVEAAAVYVDSEAEGGESVAQGGGSESSIRCMTATASRFAPKIYP